MDYNDTISTITSRPGDTEACFDINIINDNLVENDRECFLRSFTVEDLDDLVIGNSSALCCIVDDDSKYMVVSLEPGSPPRAREGESLVQGYMVVDGVHLFTRFCSSI